MQRSLLILLKVMFMLKLSNNPLRHGVPQLKFKPQLNNSKLGLRPLKLIKLKFQAKAQRMKLNLLSLKSLMVSASKTTVLVLLMPELRASRQDLEPLSPLMRWKHHSKTHNGEMLRLKDKLSLNQQEVNSSKRKLMISSRLLNNTSK